MVLNFKILNNEIILEGGKEFSNQKELLVSFTPTDRIVISLVSGINGGEFRCRVNSYEKEVLLLHDQFLLNELKLRKIVEAKLVRVFPNFYISEERYPNMDQILVSQIEVAKQKAALLTMDIINITAEKRTPISYIVGFLDDNEKVDINVLANGSMKIGRCYDDLEFDCIYENFFFINEKMKALNRVNDNVVEYLVVLNKEDVKKSILYAKYVVPYLPKYIQKNIEAIKGYLADLESLVDENPMKDIYIFKTVYLKEKAEE